MFHPCLFPASLPRSLLLFLASTSSVLLAFAAASANDDTKETSRQNPIALGYYNLIITEYSYKFWAAFMIATLAMLLYSCLAAVWVAHTVYLPPPISYDEYDYLAKRSASEEEDEDHIDPSPGGWPANPPPSPSTARRILRAISQPPLPS
ncbi:uncharacterized protein LOC124174224 [Ischnura elegans]|uniref:uncharacterized protein LOC124174224 n=1 Tax=Ischnura elegans TaxID=197161 RepID=UPI001ED868D7|nr:uncharacterized protein LOC124174224 [Ischnura elegans]